ncbi:hypothetical protein [Janthinobacterium sp. LM6]|uniref:hypothetical protein n=1 Tax=Janthinobacterium sp. LM6 TaxID=1938606 RepID=UPI0012372C6B|nr:hypothetical protein [Janthinobacterium sp. LM6]
MIKFLSFSIFALLATSTGWAQAQCNIAKTVESEYGLSFSGMKKEVPEISDTSLLPKPQEKLSSVRLLKSAPYVPDGFFFSLVINEKKDTAWIRRIGGFASAPAFFGPVPINASMLVGCKLEK